MALYGHQVGLDAELLLFRLRGVQPDADEAALARTLAVRQTVLPHPLLLPLAVIRAHLRGDLHRLPAGGTSPLTSLAYINAGLELAAQVRAGDCPEPRAIGIPLGSGGTAAGLLVGCALGGLRSTIVAVRAVERIVANRWRVQRLARRALRLLQSAGGSLGTAGLLDSSRLVVVGEALGRGYGLPSPEGEEIRHRVLALEGIPLDGTYTAKALAGLLLFTRREGLTRQPLLFWNTVNSRPLPDLEAISRALGMARGGSPEDARARHGQAGA